MEAEALEGFQSNGIPPDQVVFLRSADMRYAGQFHEVEVELSGGDFTAQRLEAALNEFHKRHEKLYTFDMPWKSVQFLTFRLRATAARAPFQLRHIETAGTAGAPPLKRRRSCWFDGREVDTPVYDGSRLLAGSRFGGPAIIEETTTTVVIPASYVCRVDQWKNYILTRLETADEPRQR
jgi:N-methylhydantoinase A